MKKAIIFLFFLLTGVFILSNNGWSFRCGNDLITTGDTRVKTSYTCGQPTSKEQRCLKRHVETGICLNKGEAWYYNCGENDFIYVLVFNEDGTLEKEDTAGRGYGSSDCRGRLSR